MFDLKLLTREAIPGALGKAERYRLLNQPWEAESIYLDVLQIDPDNQDALIGGVLAATDQFDDDLAGSAARARELLHRIRDEYERTYYAALICERRAKAILRAGRPNAGSIAHSLIEEALDLYGRAEKIRPEGNDDTLLRWNACVRMTTRHRQVVAAADERVQPYGDA
jgi:hypothetical protein